MNAHDACEIAYANGYENGVADTLARADVLIVDDFGPVSNAKVFGLHDSIRRAKFPMSTDVSKLNKELTSGIERLAKSRPGEGHDQFLTGVIVQFDLTLTNKCWCEAERYHFLDFVSSQSTMHRITKFDLDCAYDEHVDPRIIDVIKSKVAEYQDMMVKDTSEEKLKEKYLEILYCNPAGFKLTAGMTTNYRQLKTIYRQRKHHRLKEWRDFCRWIETLPMSELITCVDN